MGDRSASVRIAVAAGAVMSLLAIGVTSPAFSPTLATSVSNSAVDPTAPRTTGAAALAPSPPSSKKAPYAFLMKDDFGKPARWNPCSAITWNWLDGTSQERALATKAFAQIVHATGLRFVYAETKADVDVHFGTLRTGLLGYGSFYADRISTVGGKTDGWIATSGDLTVSPRARKLDSTYMLNLLMHEIGHIVGLGHVADRHQVMFKEVQERTSWGAGDLAGLARVGSREGCITRH